jgi:hypothetical protein
VKLRSHHQHLKKFRPENLHEAEIFVSAQAILINFLSQHSTSNTGGGRRKKERKNVMYTNPTSSISIFKRLHQSSK